MTCPSPTWEQNQGLCTIAVLPSVNNGLREVFKNPDLSHASHYTDGTFKHHGNRSIELQPRWIHYHVMSDELLDEFT